MSNSVDFEDITLFSSLADLPSELWEDVRSRPLREIAAQSGAELSRTGLLALPFLNGSYVIDPVKQSITPPGPDWPLTFQLGLTLLTYLAKAKETGLAGRMVAGRELNGGELFFTGVHALPVEPLAESFAADPARFKARALQLGAIAVDGADLSLRILALPKILLGLTIYGPDEEFPAQATYTFDANCDHHLALDGILALTNVLTGMLIR